MTSRQYGSFYRDIWVSYQVPAWQGPYQRGVWVDQFFAIRCSQWNTQWNDFVRYPGNNTVGAIAVDCGASTQLLQPTLNAAIQQNATDAGSLLATKIYGVQPSVDPRTAVGIGTNSAGVIHKAIAVKQGINVPYNLYGPHVTFDRDAGAFCQGEVSSSFHSFRAYKWVAGSICSAAYVEYNTYTYELSPAIPGGIKLSSTARFDGATSDTDYGWWWKYDYHPLI